MRRFLLSGSFMSVVVAGLSLLGRTLTRPLSWHVLLLWLGWLISLVLAISAINDRARYREGL